MRGVKRCQESTGRMKKHLQQRVQGDGSEDGQCPGHRDEGRELRQSTSPVPVHRPHLLALGAPRTEKSRIFRLTPLPSRGYPKKPWPGGAK